jgi:hypothetical protein
MNVIQKTLATTIVRNRGDISDEDVAKHHQAFAMEMFPDSKNIGVALSKFYDTDVGKIALGYAAQTKYSELQKAERCGDGDIALEKDDAGDVKDGPKVHHHHPKKRPQKATSHDGYSPQDDHDPNRLNNIPEQVVSRMAKCCDSLAEFYAEENGVSKNVAYDALMKSNRLFQMMWKYATQPAQP